MRLPKPRRGIALLGFAAAMLFVLAACAGSAATGAASPGASATPHPTAPEAFDRMIREETARMAKLIRDAGIRLE